MDLQHLRTPLVKLYKEIRAGSLTPTTGRKHYFSTSLKLVGNRVVLVGNRVQTTYLDPLCDW